MAPKVEHSKCDEWRSHPLWGFTRKFSMAVARPVFQGWQNCPRGITWYKSRGTKPCYHNQVDDVCAGKDRTYWSLIARKFLGVAKGRHLVVQGWHLPPRGYGPEGLFIAKGAPFIDTLLFESRTLLGGYNCPKPRKSPNRLKYQVTVLSKQKSHKLTSGSKLLCSFLCKLILYSFLIFL